MSRRQTPNFKQILEYAVDQEEAIQRFQKSGNSGNTPNTHLSPPLMCKQQPSILSEAMAGGGVE